MTSNLIIMTLPTQSFNSYGEGTMETARELMRQEVRKYFKPELLNLLDEILIFDPISYGQLRNVARLQLQDVASHLEEKGIQLNVAEAALVVIYRESQTVPHLPKLGSNRSQKHQGAVILHYSAIWPQSGRNYWTLGFQIRSRGIRVQWRLRGRRGFRVCSPVTGNSSRGCVRSTNRRPDSLGEWYEEIRTTTARWVLLEVGAELVEHAGEGDGAVTVRRRTEEPVAESAGMKF
ncbi:hypothetical protein Acr_23g0005380 [Actinidia rufa]|uniref:Uncharacterized protein n=1 Tax=Actinidia rufa TaxID=165716 RepID=A0A7J0GMX3_9ERIC|nr:hypothetical protein Acr_23g0005380 [Actinidia rufa]